MEELTDEQRLWVWALTRQQEHHNTMHYERELDNSISRTPKPIYWCAMCDVDRTKRTGKDNIFTQLAQKMDI